MKKSIRKLHPKVNYRGVIRSGYYIYNIFNRFPAVYTSDPHIQSLVFERQPAMGMTIGTVI